MLVNIGILISSFLFVLFSIIGYGHLFQKILKIDKNAINIGLTGFYGIFILIVYSYFSNLFIAHSIYHNFLLILIGFIFFIFLTFKNKTNGFRKNNYLILIISLIIILSLLIFKNHDDFSYYHFPYTYYLTQESLNIGIGQFGHGFRTPSSIFYLNSLFYLPLIEYYSFNFGQAIVFCFANIYFLKNINFFTQEFKLNKNSFNYINYLSLLIFIFINVFFYRISEHGTDRSAQILIFVFIIELLKLIDSRKINELKLSSIFIIPALIISLKSFYIIYGIFFVIISYYIFSIKKNIFLSLKIIFLNKFFFLFLILFFFVLLTNFFNTGCLIYPLAISCFENVQWNISIVQVQKMNDWYELWSKAGATPNFRVEDMQNYIQYFNWLNGWIERYFFNKVSDFLLGIIFLNIVILFTFKKNISFQNIFRSNKFLYLIYFTIIILTFEWFYNHPALRYGGYCLFALLFFIPVSLTLKKNSLKMTKVSQYFFILIFLSTSIFVTRNFLRIKKEINIYNYKPVSQTFYKVDEHDFRVTKQMNEIKINSNECLMETSECDLNKKKVKKVLNKYIFITND